MALFLNRYYSIMDAIGAKLNKSLSLPHGLQLFLSNVWVYLYHTLVSGVRTSSINYSKIF